MVSACKATVKTLNFCDTYDKPQQVTSYFINSTNGDFL